VNKKKFFDPNIFSMHMDYYTFSNSKYLHGNELTRENEQNITRLAWSKVSYINRPTFQFHVVWD